MSPHGAGDVIRARVHAGSVAIPYVQAGRGAPVVLLTLGAKEPNETLHFRSLARHFRVVAPARPSGGDVRVDGEATSPVALSHMLRDFLDGLGLGRVGLVAEEPFGVAALGFALSEPERIGGLALVFADEADPVDPSGGMGDAFVGAGLSVLVLRSRAGKAGIESWCPDLVRFLTETSSAPDQAAVL